MAEKNQKMKIGIFIITGFLLLLTTLFFLGLSDIFIDKVQLVTRFRESVQGLTVGSPVKYRGVQVGTVSGISIMMQKKNVWVSMEIEPRFFRGMDKSGFERAFRKELQNGLACRMEFAGITGMKFIDLDYFRNAEASLQIPDDLPDNNAIYVMSVPSTFQDLSTAVVNAMERLSKIRFEEISEEIERSLTSLNTLLADPAIKATIAKLNEAAANLESSTGAINQAVNEEKLINLLDELDRNLKAFHNLTTTLDKTSQEMKLPESTLALRNAANSITECQSDLSDTINKFNRTLESVRIFFDYLGHDPSAVIKGKKQKTILK